MNSLNNNVNVKKNECGQNLYKIFRDRFIVQNDYNNIIIHIMYLNC